MAKANRMDVVRMLAVREFMEREIRGGRKGWVERRPEIAATFSR